jgi:ribosomal protein S18 acetylase RimI-like enzyme
MPTVEIRQAGPRDLEGVVAIEDSVFAGEPYRIARRQWSYLLGRDCGAVFVAEAAGSIVGTLVLTHRAGGRTLRIYSLAVAPSARRRGVARRLIDVAKNYAADNGLQQLHLEVGVSNRAALALYRAAGFEARTRIANYYGLGEDGYRMETSLGRPRG